VAENGERKTQKILEGIQYLIGDNKQLREELRAEFREFARRTEEDRKRADQDRRRSDDRFELLMEKSDERFAFLADQIKRTNRVAVDIARDLRRKTGELLDGQENTNKLLGEILKRLPPTNGH
jgi:hypothetical protein